MTTETTMTTTITVWENLSKNDLVQWASTHPDFKKSMGREKKEVLVRFLMDRNICHSCIPPITASKPEKTEKTLSRKTKAELFTLCKEKDGFDASIHGKTRLTMLEFLRGPSNKTVDLVHGTDKTDDTGTSPVDIGTLLDTPEDPQVIRQAILRLLMETEPFRTDPEIQTKLEKMV